MKNADIEVVMDKMVDDFSVRDILRALQSICLHREHANKDTGESDMEQYFRQCRMAATVCLGDLP